MKPKPGLGVFYATLTGNVEGLYHSSRQLHEEKCKRYKTQNKEDELYLVADC